MPALYQPTINFSSGQIKRELPARLVRFAGQIEMRFTGHFGETMQKHLRISMKQ